MGASSPSTWMQSYRSALHQPKHLPLCTSREKTASVRMQIPKAGKIVDYFLNVASFAESSVRCNRRVWLLQGLWGHSRPVEWLWRKGMSGAEEWCAYSVALTFWPANLLAENVKTTGQDSGVAERGLYLCSNDLRCGEDQDAPCPHSLHTSKPFVQNFPCFYQRRGWSFAGFKFSDPCPAVCDNARFSCVLQLWHKHQQSKQALLGIFRNLLKEVQARCTLTHFLGPLICSRVICASHPATCQDLGPGMLKALIA